MSTSDVLLDHVPGDDVVVFDVGAGDATDEQLDELRLHAVTRALHRQHVGGDDRARGNGRRPRRPSGAPWRTSLPTPPATARASRRRRARPRCRGCARRGRAAPAARPRTGDRGRASCGRACSASRRCTRRAPPRRPRRGCRWCGRRARPAHRTRLASTGIERRFITCAGAGYSDAHCSSAISSQPASRAATTASSISPRLAMPVDRMSGRPHAAAYRMNGRSTSSNEAILNAPTSSASSSSTAWRSNGDDMNSMPRSRQCSARIGCQSRGSAISSSSSCAGLAASSSSRKSKRGRLGGVERPARVGLELHRVGAGLGGDVDQLAGDAEIAVVVGAGLRDHVAGLARARPRDRSP